jgi:hypothetical protein
VAHTHGLDALEFAEAHLWNRRWSIGAQLLNPLHLARDPALPICDVVLGSGEVRLLPDE